MSIPAPGRVCDLLLYPGHGRRAPGGGRATRGTIARDEAAAAAAAGFRGVLLLRVSHCARAPRERGPGPELLSAWAAFVDVPTGRILRSRHRFPRSPVAQ